MSTLINIAEQFSTVPAGRFRTDGEFSGQRFREELLVPALRGQEKVVVELSGTKGYGSSFLEEAFGGLIRCGLFSAAYLKEHLDVIATNPAYEIYRKKVLDYLAAARPMAERFQTAAG